MSDDGAEVGLDREESKIFVDKLGNVVNRSGIVVLICR